MVTDGDGSLSYQTLSPNLSLFLFFCSQLMLDLSWPKNLELESLYGSWDRALIISMICFEKITQQKYLQRETLFPKLTIKISELVLKLGRLC